MNSDEARAAVIDQLQRRGVGGADGISIIESQTIEKPYGWIFFYNSRRYVESGELVYALVGQGPVVVVADTREIIELGSAYPSEVAIKQLEDRLGLGRRS
jgi:hypothetical protein